jgi:hypothetical protein
VELLLVEMPVVGKCFWGDMPIHDTVTLKNKKPILDQTENELGTFIVTPFGCPAVLCEGRIRGYASSDYSDFALIDEA